MSVKLSNRGLDWLDFTCDVLTHIEEYTVPQYGDSPDDQVQTWTAEQCLDSMRRYLARFGRNARGLVETFRDMLKVAHYACLVYNKLKEEGKHNETDKG